MTISSQWQSILNDQAIACQAQGCCFTHFAGDYDGTSFVEIDEWVAAIDLPRGNGIMLGCRRAVRASQCGEAQRTPPLA